MKAFQRHVKTFWHLSVDEITVKVRKIRWQASNHGRHTLRTPMAYSPVYITRHWSKGFNKNIHHVWNLKHLFPPTLRNIKNTVHLQLWTDSYSTHKLVCVRTSGRLGRTTAGLQPLKRTETTTTKKKFKFLHLFFLPLVFFFFFFLSLWEDLFQVLQRVLSPGLPGGGGAACRVRKRVGPQQWRRTLLDQSTSSWQKAREESPIRFNHQSSSRCDAWVGHTVQHVMQRGLMLQGWGFGSTCRNRPTQPIRHRLPYPTFGNELNVLPLKVYMLTRKRARLDELNRVESDLLSGVEISPHSRQAAGGSGTPGHMPWGVFPGCHWGPHWGPPLGSCCCCWC